MVQAVKLEQSSKISEVMSTDPRVMGIHKLYPTQPPRPLSAPPASGGALTDYRPQVGGLGLSLGVRFATAYLKPQAEIERAFESPNPDPYVRTLQHPTP